MNLTKKTVKQYVVMGVAGCGKTSVGKSLASFLNGTFIDADDFHSIDNKNKMTSGIPLTDEDRRDWLNELHEVLHAGYQSEKTSVLACSALKQSYRDVLSKGIEVIFIYLKLSLDEAVKRIDTRKGHFFGSKIIASQFEILEEPTNAIVVDAALPFKEVVSDITKKLDKGLLNEK